MNKLQLLATLRGFREKAATLDQNIIGRPELEQVHAGDSLEVLIYGINNLEVFYERDLRVVLSYINLVLSGMVYNVLPNYMEQLWNIVSDGLVPYPTAAPVASDIYETSTVVPVVSDDESDISETATDIMPAILVNPNGTIMSVIPTYVEDDYYDISAWGSDSIVR